MNYQAKFNNQEVGQLDILAVLDIVSKDMQSDLFFLSQNQKMSFVSFGGVWTFERLSSDEEIANKIDSLLASNDNAVYSTITNKKLYNILTKLI